MARYISLNFLLCSEIIYVCSGSSDSTTKTRYLFMYCDSHQQNFSIPKLGRGPPVGRGPQVENRCFRELRRVSVMKMIVRVLCFKTNKFKIFSMLGFLFGFLFSE